MTDLLTPPATGALQATPEEAEDTGVRPRRWTVEEYYRAAELGIFRPGEKLELIKGEVIQKMSPQEKPHAASIQRVARAMRNAFGDACDVRPQLPMTLPDATEPEPDVLVADRREDDYLDHHPMPAEVRLIVEISDTTLRYDQVKKAAVYAEAGLEDYWILNLKTRCLEVRREPAALPGAPFGFGYKRLTIHTQEEQVSPLAAPAAVIRVVDLLPPVPQEQKEP